MTANRADGADAPDTTNGTEPTPARRKVRWGRRLLLGAGVLLVLVIAGIAAGPTIASTSGVRTFVLGRVNNTLKGELAADTWSLSWFGPTTLNGLAVRDAEQREVLRADSVALSAGLWQLLTTGGSFGELRIEAPAVRLVLDEQNNVTLADAVSARSAEPPVPARPAGDRPPGRVPSIRGRLVVEDGSVTVTRADGAPYEVRDLNVDVAVNTLNDISGQLGMILDDGKPLTGSVELTGLAPDNVLNTANASGTATVATDGEVDIAKLARVLAGQEGMQGRAQLAVKLEAQPDDLRVAADVRVIDLVSPQVDSAKKLNLALTGSAALEGEQITADCALAGPAEKFVTVSVQGTRRDVTATLDSDLARLRRELGQALDLGSLDFGGQARGTIRVTERPEGYATRAELDLTQFALRTADRDVAIGSAKLSQDGLYRVAGGAVESSGELVMQQVSASGSLIDQQATVSWSEVVTGETIGAAAIAIDSTAAQLDAKDVAVDTATGTIGKGHLTLAADLAKAMQVVAAVAGMAEPPAIKGQLEFEADVAGSAGAQQLRGAGAITALEIGTAENAVREDRVDLNVDARFDPAARVITLGENRIRSKPLTVTLRGAVREYDENAVAAIDGNYELSWPAITTLLHELAPATRDLVSLEGTSSSPLKLTGPLSQPDQRPTFRGLDAALDVQWERAALAGIPVEAAGFSPSLTDGQLTLPKSTLTSKVGKVNVGMAVDFKPEDPTLRVPGVLEVLDGVQITSALSRELLSRINPIFYQFVDATGRVDLRVQDLVLPLGPTIDVAGAGTGKLDLIDMKVRPGGLVRELVRLAGLADADELLTVGIRGADFEVRAGRVHYDDFTLIFPSEFDVKFYGSVGFDDTLDLVVSVPVRPELLQRLGVRGDVQRYAELLRDTRVDVPLAGTRRKPELDLSRVDVKKLVEDVIKQEGGAALEEGLKKLLGGEDGGSGSKESAGSATSKPASPLGEILDNVRKQKPEQKQKRERSRKPDEP